MGRFVEWGGTGLRLVLVFWMLAGSVLLTGCAAHVENPLDDFKQEIEESDEGTVNALVDKFDEWFDSTEMGISLTLLRVLEGFVGVLLLFAGFAIYEFFVMLPGFVIGGVIGYGIGADTHVVIGLILMVICGLFGGYLVLILENLATFLISMFLGAIIVGAVTDFEPLAMIIGGIIVGSVVLALIKLAIIVLTSGVGAILFGGLAIGMGSTMIVILGIVGMSVQFGLLSLTEDETASEAVSTA